MLMCSVCRGPRINPSEDTLREIEDILYNPKSWSNIQAYLIKTYNQHFKELFEKGVNKERFQEVKGRKFKVIRGFPPPR